MQDSDERTTSYGEVYDPPLSWYYVPGFVSLLLYVCHKLFVGTVWFTVSWSGLRVCPLWAKAVQGV